MLNPDFGAINGTLKGAGVNTEALTWTASPTLALASVIAVDIWQWTPFIFLVLLAGLQAIPKSLMKPRHRWVERVADLSSRNTSAAEACDSHCVAASHDGPAASVRSDIHTDRGGPGFSTETVSLYIYRTAFRFSDFGYAARCRLCCWC